MTLENIGLEQLVPATAPIDPSTTICMPCPCAETSGYARPETLNFPELVDPRTFKYDAIAGT